MGREVKNYPGTRIPWYRIDACFRLSLHYYFNAKNNLEFENIILTSENFSKKEKEAILNHWKKEIYPVKKHIAEWMWELSREINLNFKTNLKELNKLGFKIISKKQNVRKHSNTKR